MFALTKQVVHQFGRKYCRRIAQNEHDSQTFTRLNERAIEYRFVFNGILQTRPKTILDVGTGTSALPSLMRTCGPVVSAVDNVRDYWPGDMINRHYFVRNEDATRRISGSYDLVTCVSVLEHISSHQEAVTNMLSAVRPGGYLILTFPYNEHRYVANVYALPGGSYGKDLQYICQVYSRWELTSWLTGRAEIANQEYWRVFSGPLWTFGETLTHPVQTTADDLHQLTCLLIRKHPST
jgi:SAM-dependent methyltransferase